MYADFGPGQVAELDRSSPDGMDLLYGDEYVAARMRTEDAYGYVSNNPVRLVDPMGLEKVNPVNGVETRKCMVTIFFGHPLFLARPIIEHRRHYQTWSGWKPGDAGQEDCYRMGAISCGSEQARIRGTIPNHLQIHRWPWIRAPLLKVLSSGLLAIGVDRAVKEAAYLGWCGDPSYCCDHIALRFICQADAADYVQRNGGNTQIPSLGVTSDKVCGNVKVDTPIGRLGPGRYPITPWYVGEFKVKCSDLPNPTPEEYRGP